MNDQNAPSEPQQTASPHSVEPIHDRAKPRRGNIVAVLLILIGVIALINQLFPKSWIKWELFWPIMIILLGVWMIARKR